ncbi:hypothetical protein HY572_02560 [Candidatus Micrarchaeota archaeon]|nr:hypothetical protein [Candidatus Micrarchaeota archaeon]
MQKALMEASKRLFLEYGINPDSVKELDEFLHGIQEFVQYLGSNQYYSDAVNKKIFLLTLDVDAALLRFSWLHLEAIGFRDALTKSVLARKKKEGLDEKKVAAFNDSFNALTQDARDLHERALALTDDIRKEYAKKL